MAEFENTGPFLSIAVLCETVIQEQNGPLSLIRLVDTLNRGAAGLEAPPQMEPFDASFSMVIQLRAGQARGSFGVKIRPEHPSGERAEAVEQSVHLAGGPWGASVIVPIQMTVGETGVYWFDVILCDHTADAEQLLTRIPLEVIYSRTATG